MSPYEVGYADGFDGEMFNPPYPEYSEEAEEYEEGYGDGYAKFVETEEETD